MGGGEGGGGGQLKDPGHVEEPINDALKLGEGGG